MSCLTELYFSSTGVRLEIVKSALLWAFERVTGSDSLAAPAQPSLAQTAFFVQQALEAHRVLPELRLPDLSRQLAASLLPPAVFQLFEGLKQAQSPGRNIPF